MSDNKYTVTFKAAKAGTLYVNDSEYSTSVAGHMWYVLKINGEAQKSYGFIPKRDGKLYVNDLMLDGNDIIEGDISTNDDLSYKPRNGDISEITIQINKEQYNKLVYLGDGGGLNFIDGYYNVLTNNCVSFVFKALHLIGYNPGDRDPVAFPLADNANIFNDGTYNNIHNIINLNGFLEIVNLLAENGAIAVDGDTLIPVSEYEKANKMTKSVSQKILEFMDEALTAKLSSFYTNDPLGKLRDWFNNTRTITGYNDSNDKIYGGKGRDTLIGKGGNDKLYGGEGDDTLYGDDEEGTSISNPPDLDLSNNNSGFSTSTSDIDNEKNSDILNGGEGKDTMYGGKGYDIYYIGGEDTIIDADGEGEIRFLDKNHQVIPEDEEGFSPTSPLEGHIVSFSPGSVIFEAEDYRFELSEETLTVTQESTGHKAIIKNSGLSKFAQTGKTGLSSIELSDIAHCYDGCHNVIRIYYEEGRVLKPPYIGPNRPELNTEKKEENKIPEENKTPENNVPEINVQENKLPANIFTAKSTQSQTTLNMHARNNKAIGHIQLLQANSGFTKYRLEGNDLLLFGYNGADSLLIKGFYNSPHNLQNFRFSDRTLSLEQMKTEGITLSGTINDDTMHDWNKTANTTFRAGKGNDKINAGDGNDTLIGGTGNDLLQGGNGKDTYMFEKGHGQDIITEFNTTKDEDTIQFNDIDFNQVKFRRDNYDLTLFGYHEQDSVTIKAFFADQANQLENYQFSDRTLTREQFNEEMVLADTQVNRMIQVAANFGAQSESGGISSTQEETKNLPQLAPSV